MEPRSKYATSPAWKTQLPSDRLRGEAIHYFELSIICVRELVRGMIARREGGGGVELVWFPPGQGWKGSTQFRQSTRSWFKMTSQCGSKAQKERSESLLGRIANDLLQSLPFSLFSLTFAHFFVSLLHFSISLSDSKLSFRYFFLLIKFWFYCNPFITIISSYYLGRQNYGFWT